MKVRELINELTKLGDLDADVHLDISNHDEEWEGDRVVRAVAGVRRQSGYHAVAIDGDRAGIGIQ